MSLYVRVNALFMTLCHYMSSWMVCSWLYVIICEVEWSVHDFMSLYVRLNGLFMTLCHYMSGWMVCSWLYVTICQVEWSICDFDFIICMNECSVWKLITFFVWMNGLWDWMDRVWVNFIICANKWSKVHIGRSLT